MGKAQTTARMTCQAAESHFGLVARHLPIKVIMVRERHLQAMFAVVSQRVSFFIDSNLAQDFEAFKEWYAAHVQAALIAIRDGEVLGFAYLDEIHEGYHARVNIIKAKGGLGHFELVAVCARSLPFWFKRYDLQKMVGFTKVKAAARLARCVGFSYDGVIRHHRKDKDGQWVDYQMVTILRSEAWKQRRRLWVRLLMWHYGL